MSDVEKNESDEVVLDEASETEDVDVQTAQGDESDIRVSTLRQKAIAGSKFVAVLIAGALLGVLFFGNDPQTIPATQPQQTHKHTSTTYTCSMHPQVQASEPGKCPICAMDLVPADSLDADSGASVGEIKLTARAKVLAQLRTSPVKRMTAESERGQLLGRVAANEGTERVISPWISGRVDRLYVTTTGARVKRGQALARVYSPEVYAAHQELLAALKQVTSLSESNSYAKQAAKAQLEAVQQKLRLLGMSTTQLKQMEKAKSPWSQVTIRSSVTGTVLKRMVNQGDYVKVGQAMFKVADLSNVWVLLDAYESDLSQLDVNQTVLLTFEALSSVVIEGKIKFIDPVVDAKNRTIQVRVEVSNKAGRLKPGMYARATINRQLIESGGAIPMVIPKTAPLFAGRRALVYVEKSSDAEGSVYVGKEVKLGARVGDDYIVLAGLERGDRVVTQGAFAIDSDLQLRGGLSLMGRKDDTQRKGEDILKLDPKARAQLKPIVSGYLDVQELLANDEFAPAMKRAKGWLKAIEQGTLSKGSGAVRVAWKGVKLRLQLDAKQLVESKDIGSMRVIFQNLTRTMEEVLLRFGNPTPEVVRLAYCPMAFNNKGGQWFQRAKEVDNVYYGNQMRRCGEIRTSVAPNAHFVSQGGSQ